MESGKILTWIWENLIKLSINLVQKIPVLSAALKSKRSDNNQIIHTTIQLIQINIYRK